jgi:hypothetical protein
MMQSVSPLRIVVPMVVHSPTKAKVNVNDEGVAGGTSISRPSLHQEQCTELASGPYRWYLAPYQEYQGVLAGTNGLHGWYSEYQDEQNQRWMGASIKMHRINNGWNGCNLFKNYTKYCSTTRGEPLHLSEYVRLHLSTARSYRRRHSPTMCTVSCKPPELDLLKGEGSNLQKTGVHLMTQWKHHLTQKDRELYNTAARLIN